MKTIADLLTLDDLCRAAAVSPQWVRRCVDEGLLPVAGAVTEDWRFDLVVLRRVRVMRRLERDFDADNGATAYANATPVRRTYWQCPRDGPLIVFSAKAIPTDGKWHGQSSGAYKMQCKRIRLKSFINAPKKGAIYGVNRLNSSTVAGDWKLIHQWSNASKASAPYTSFPQDAKWCFAGTYSSSESDINSTAHDYTHDGTTYFSDNSSAGCFLKFRYQIPNCFKPIG